MGSLRWMKSFGDLDHRDQTPALRSSASLPPRDLLLFLLSSALFLLPFLRLTGLNHADSCCRETRRSSLSVDQRANDLRAVPIAWALDWRRRPARRCLSSRGGAPREQRGSVLSHWRNSWDQRGSPLVVPPPYFAYHVFLYPFLPRSLSTTTTLNDFQPCLPVSVFSCSAVVANELVTDAQPCSSPPLSPCPARPVSLLRIPSPVLRSDVPPAVVADYESAPIPPKGLPTANGSEEKKEAMGTAIAVTDADVDDEGREPTEEELTSLRIVPAALGWPGE